MTDGANQDLGHPVSRQRRGTWSYEEGEGAAFDRVTYFTDAGLRDRDDPVDRLGRSA
jgi:hypothetical protein